MLRSSKLVVCSVDSFITPTGKILRGFDEFSTELEAAKIPLIWVSRRTRLQLDEARRKLGSMHPFIAEGGSGAYLPEDYFHLRPAKTVRLGRFTCIPIAQIQPAATEALNALAEETAVPIVALRSLSPRELSQNSGLPQREAELLRQRDFDELFFFAGASDSDIQRFRAAADSRQYQLRPDGIVWSLAIYADLRVCLRELAKLYERALRSRPEIIALAADDTAADLFPASNRRILLTSKSESAEQLNSSHGATVISIHAPDAWSLAASAALSNG